MDFKILMDTEKKVKTFDTITSARIFIANLIKKHCERNSIMIAFVKYSLDKYVIYYDVLYEKYFIDSIIDYINQWQYEHDEYIEYIIIPYYENILTIEIDY